MRCLVNPFKKFTIANISKKLNEININISLSHQNLFPNMSLLSTYRFKKRFVRIYENGDIQGGYCRMIISLIDLSLRGVGPMPLRAGGFHPIACCPMLFPLWTSLRGVGSLSIRCALSHLNLFPLERFNSPSFHKTCDLL